MTVGLVVVSHSARLAEGVCEVAAQMAPDVWVPPAGGMADGVLVRLREGFRCSGGGQHR